jgi:hypothetical protein
VPTQSKWATAIVGLLAALSLLRFAFDPTRLLTLAVAFVVWCGMLLALLLVYGWASRFFLPRPLPTLPTLPAGHAALPAVPSAQKAA